MAENNENYVVNETNEEAPAEVSTEYTPEVKAGPSTGFVVRVGAVVVAAGYGIYAGVRDFLNWRKDRKEKKAKEKAVQKDGEVVIDAIDDIPDDIPEK